MKRRRESEDDRNKTQLEDLSNELLYEIFDYGDYCSMHEIFANLNLRFQSLITQTPLPLNVDFPLISKSIYEQRCVQLIQPNIQRIISLNITKHFLDFFAIDLFSSLQSLTVQHISSEKINSLLLQLRSLTNFSSLSIQSEDYFQNENILYSSIFHLTKLKFCKLKYQRGGDRVPLPLATSPCRILEHLIIDSHCRLDQLISILSYLPQLKHLSCSELFNADYDEIKLSLKLTTIHLKLVFVSFTTLKSLLSNVSSRLKILRIETTDNGFLYAEQWQQLIEQYMPLLQTFDFRYSTSADVDNQERLIQGFSSNFWNERNWFFDHYYHYLDDDLFYFHFFSIVPYKYDQFELHVFTKYHEPKSYEKNHINYARHVKIEDCLKRKNYTIQFPCVKELTLQSIDVKKNSWLTRTMKSIIPLLQITKLNLYDQRITNKKLTTFLHALPNLESLTLTNLSPSTAKRPNMSRITRVSLYEKCHIKHLEFLIDVFPRVEHLKISIDENHLEEILQFLVLKAKYLFLLIIHFAHYEMIEVVKAIIQKNQLVNNYSVERIDGELYLWC